jgi:hypothetical protein
VERVGTESCARRSTERKNPGLIVIVIFLHPREGEIRITITITIKRGRPELGDDIVACSQVYRAVGAETSPLTAAVSCTFFVFQKF